MGNCKIACYNCFMSAFLKIRTILTTEPSPTNVSTGRHRYVTNNNGLPLFLGWRLAEPPGLLLSDSRLTLRTEVTGDLET
jgi:hypothetical protein